MALEAKVDTIAGESFTIELLASATATNGAPTGTAGISTNAIRDEGEMPDAIRVGVRSTAGSGTMTVALRLWMQAGGIWFPAQALAADPSTPYTAGTIPEVASDLLAYSEWVFGLKSAARLYLEIVAIAGSSTAVTGYAIVG